MGEVDKTVRCEMRDQRARSCSILIGGALRSAAVRRAVLGGTLEAEILAAAGAMVHAGASTAHVGGRCRCRKRGDECPQAEDEHHQSG
jgi:hypothetical protein